MANDVFETITTTYTQIDDSFDQLFAACTTAAQRAQLRSLYASARDTFFAAEAKALTDNSITVTTLTKQLQGANVQVKAQLQSLKNVVEAINLITEAVKLAASLATLAAGA